MRITQPPESGNKRAPKPVPKQILPLVELARKFTALFWSPQSPFYQQLDADIMRYLYWTMLQCASADYHSNQGLYAVPNVLEPLGTMPCVNLYYQSSFDPTVADLMADFIWHLSEKSVARQITGGPYALTGAKWKVAFPKPTGLQVNMLPLDLYDLQGTLPPTLNAYAKLLRSCAEILSCSNRSERRRTDLEKSQIVYLTIDEGLVQAGTSQRRGGIHTDSPGMFVDYIDQGRTISYFAGEGHPWGGGEFYIEELHLEHGIFMASNVADSCRVWNVSVDPLFIGAGGDCEHLRPFLQEDHTHEGCDCYTPGANELWWITDRTPHEALALKDGAHRQFFRLVVGPIGVWYSQHSTPNPLCPLPINVVTINSNKFTGK